MFDTEFARALNSLTTFSRLLGETLISGGSSDPFDPATTTGVVAAWDMETVYQDSSLSTAAGEGDPIGGVPDLRGNSNILSQTTSAARPTLQTAGGLWYADFDGSDDFFSVTLPNGQRTSDMTLMLGLDMDATEPDLVTFSAFDSDPPYVGFVLNGGGSSVDFASGVPSYHIDDGAALTRTRDALRDALVAAGACVWETRGFDMTTIYWTNNGTAPSLFNYSSGTFQSVHKMYRGILIDNLTISADDLAAARQWVADGTGVTL